MLWLRSAIEAPLVQAQWTTGPDAPGLSASTITRLKADWWDDYERWSKRDLSARRYAYFWADGVYFSPGMEEDRQCMPVIIGADE